MQGVSDDFINPRLRLKSSQKVIFYIYLYLFILYLYILENT